MSHLSIQLLSNAQLHYQFWHKQQAKRKESRKNGYGFVASTLGEEEALEDIWKAPLNDFPSLLRLFENQDVGFSASPRRHLCLFPSREAWGWRTGVLPFTIMQMWTLQPHRGSSAMLCKNHPIGVSLRLMNCLSFLRKIMRVFLNTTTCLSPSHKQGRTSCCGPVQQTATSAFLNCKSLLALKASEYDYKGK